jgi:hypothetical protein
MKGSRFTVVLVGKVLVIIEAVMVEPALVKETITAESMEAIIVALMLPKVGLNVVDVMTNDRPKLGLIKSFGYDGD